MTTTIERIVKQDKLGRYRTSRVQREAMLAEYDGSGKMKLRPEALAMLTDGVELRGAKMRPWYERE